MAANKRMLCLYVCYFHVNMMATGDGLATSFFMCVSCCRQHFGHQIVNDIRMKIGGKKLLIDNENSRKWKFPIWLFAKCELMLASLLIDWFEREMEVETRWWKISRKSAQKKKKYEKSSRQIMAKFSLSLFSLRSPLHPFFSIFKMFARVRFSFLVN